MEFKPRPSSAEIRRSLASLSCTLGQSLQHWRESNGKKMSVAAAELGVATATWGHWETGRCFPSGENLVMLAAYTGIEPRCLLCPQACDCQPDKCCQ